MSSVGATAAATIAAIVLPTSGDVPPQDAKAQGISFEAAIVEWYRRRESSVEEALIEMHLAGVSVRRVKDITEALWGSKKYMNMKHLEAAVEEVWLTSFMPWSANQLRKTLDTTLTDFLTAGIFFWGTMLSGYM